MAKFMDGGYFQDLKLKYLAEPHKGDSAKHLIGIIINRLF